MKNSELKQLIAREFPYPQLTIRADQHIDNTLAALPEKRKTVEIFQSGEIWPSLSAYETAKQLKRSRPAVMALKWTAACLALVFVSLAAFNFLFPQTAESLPGIGGVFQAVNRFFREETGVPVPSPSPSPSPSPVLEQAVCSALPVEDNGTKLLSIERDGRATVITAQVPYLGRYRDSLETADYFDYSLFGTTAQLAKLGDDAWFADSTQVEGESVEDLGGYQVLKQTTAPDQKGETRTVTWNFQNVEIPEDGQMVLTLYECPPRSEGGLNHPNRITAQFVVDLNARKAAPADYSEAMGRVKAAPEEVFTTPRTGEFTNGWYAAEPTLVNVGDKEYYKLIFYQKDVAEERVDGSGYAAPPNWDPATVWVFLDGELKLDVTACSREFLKEYSGLAFTVGDGAFLDESIANAKYYELENGMFYDNTAYFSGTVYRRLAFGVPASALGVQDGDLGKLADRLRFGFDDNGINVFEDVSAACAEQKKKALAVYSTLCKPQKPAEENDLSFQKHFYLIKDQSPSITADENGYSFTVKFYTDLDEDLPWKATFYTYGWKEEAAVDLNLKEENYEGQQTRKRSTDNYSVEITDLLSPYSNGAQRKYTVQFFTKRPIYDPAQTDGGSTSAAPVSWCLGDEKNFDLIYSSSDCRFGGTGIVFQNHFALSPLCGGNPNVLEPTSNLKVEPQQLSCAIQFYTDTAEDLPWTLKLTADGTDYEFPLCPADTTIQPFDPYASLEGEQPEAEGENLFTTIASGPEYSIVRRRVLEDETVMFGSRAKQYYVARLFQNGSDGGFYDFSGCTWKIVDHQTGETVYDSAREATYSPER